MRSTTNTNVRGNSGDRARRRRWLLEQFGDGTRAACAMACSPNCLGTVDERTITVDRWPVPGHAGGTYARDNIRPACGPCNYSAGGALGAMRRKASSQPLDNPPDGGIS